MALGGKVNDDIGPIDRSPNRFQVSDIALDEAIALMVLGLDEILHVTGVRKLVKHDDMIIRLVEQIANVIASDEAGSARNDNLHLTAITRFLARDWFPLPLRSPVLPL